MIKVALDDIIIGAIKCISLIRVIGI